MRQHNNPFRTDPNPDLTRAISEIVAPKGEVAPKKPEKYGEKKKARQEPYVKNDRNPYTKPHGVRESACGDKAIDTLRRANAEDLKEKPGAAGKRAHRRLHKTIAGVVGEGVDATPKNPYRFGSMSAGDVAARSGPGKGAQGRLKARLKGKQAGGKKPS